jgi:hypothetical protein
MPRSAFQTLGLARVIDTGPLDRVIRITSKRGTGTVGWLHETATPRQHRTEAGLFSQLGAEDAIREFSESLERAVGRCAWAFEILPKSVAYPVVRE